MVKNPQWFEWAPEGQALAHIGGGGRMATSGKRLRTIAGPSAEPKSYTPQGKVEQGFAWDGSKRIVAARAAESEWENEPSQRPYPALFELDLKSGKQRPLTEAAKASKSGPYGEYDPIVLLRDRLAWVRSDRAEADIMLSERHGGQAAWIRGLELGDNFYEQWRWDAVLAFDAQSLSGPKK